jgi:heterotetrameric sarcosine oxidase gamma subunit
MLEQIPAVLKAQSALPELPGFTGPFRAGVTACERNLQMATVIACNGRRADVAARLKDHYALLLPDGPRRVTTGAVALIGLGPRSWLFQREAGVPVEPELSERLGDAAAVTDQSDGYVVLRLTGPRVRDLLARGISLDFHDRVFVPDCAAATDCAHIGVILWRLEDLNGFAVFEIAVFRSLAHSLWHFIEDSAAEFGLAGATAI